MIYTILHIIQAMTLSTGIILPLAKGELPGGGELDEAGEWLIVNQKSSENTSTGCP